MIRLLWVTRGLLPRHPPGVSNRIAGPTPVSGVTSRASSSSRSKTRVPDSPNSLRTMSRTDRPLLLLLTLGREMMNHGWWRWNGMGDSCGGRDTGIRRRYRPAWSDVTAARARSPRWPSLWPCDAAGTVQCPGPSSAILGVVPGVRTSIRIEDLRRGGHSITRRRCF